MNDQPTEVIGLRQIFKWPLIFFLASIISVIAIGIGMLLDANTQVLKALFFVSSALILAFGASLAVQALKVAKSAMNRNKWFG